MAGPSPNGAGLAGNRGPALLVAALCVSLALTMDASASAVPRGKSSKIALAALGSGGDRDVIVFGLPNALEARTQIAQARAEKPRPLFRKLRQRAYLYYDDSAPFQLYPHRGRVALVSVK